MSSEESSPVTEPEETDEDILNVFRTADDHYLSTSEVASNLSIGKRRTGGRLNVLYEDGRVERQEVGRAHNWALGVDEPAEPGNPDHAKLVRWHRLSRQVSRAFTKAARFFLWFGGAIVLVSLTATLQETSVPFLSNSYLLAIGYTSIICAVVGITFAGGFKVISKVTERRWAASER